MTDSDYNFCETYIELMLNIINEADQKAIDYNEELRYKALVSLDRGEPKYRNMTTKQINDMFDDILFMLLEEVKKGFPGAYETLLSALDSLLKDNYNLAQKYKMIIPGNEHLYIKEYYYNYIIALQTLSMLESKKMANKY